MASRWRTLAAGLGALTGLAGASTLWLLRRPLAKTSGTLRLPGLDGPVQVLRDPWGVPHIYAHDLHDLAFAQGFVHAQDRLWQMDFQRRLVAGRLSEILGQASSPVDRWVRVLSMRRAAERDAALINDETRAVIEAYAAGINARIDRGRRPLECVLLRYRPEPWTVADTISWAKFMSWSLSVNWEAELLRARLVAFLGPERAAELVPAYGDDRPTIVPQGMDADAGQADLAADALSRAEAARPFLGPPAGDGLGSNSWVVSGARSAGGAPLLANDMHLLMAQPCIWYENHLVSPELDATGVTFPGIPLVVAGHNGHVAWGHTNGFADVQDLYVEKLRRDQTGRVQYLYRDQWYDADVYREEIQIRGAPPVVEEVIATRHGPIINSLSPELAGPVDLDAAAQTTGEGEPVEALALRWTSLEPETTIDALLPMNTARTCHQFREALRPWAAPVQNIVYADTQGNIAYTHAGRIPVRARGDGRLPVPGWTGEYEWVGSIPFDELPHTLNPRQGYIATANNRPVSDGYRHFLGSDFAYGDRAQRIVELLEAQPVADAACFKAMHFDVRSPLAREINGYLGRLAVDDPELAPIVRRMAAWDGTLDAASPEAAVYEVFLRRMIELCAANKLGELGPRYQGRGPTPLLEEGTTFSEKSWTWLRTTLAGPDSPWFDLGDGEDRDQVMRQALADSVHSLAERFGPDPDGWSWGALHRLAYRHTLGRVRPLDRIFNRGPYPLPGDQSTVFATGHRSFGDTIAGIIGPPFRSIVDLGDLRNSWGLLAPGQSGQPGSKHYDDQIQAWFEGDYHRILYYREDVEREATDRLELLPHKEEASATRAEALTGTDRETR